MLVGGVTFGMGEAVIADREKYGMLKFVRISPAWLQSYLIGRGLARAAVAVLGALLAVGIGLALLPEVRAGLGRHGIAWGWLAVYVLLGTVMLLSLGLILAGAVLNLPRYGAFLSEAVAGVLYLLSGVVFPVSVLPAWLRPLSLCLPTTYWLEGVRRALLGPGEMPSPLSGWGCGQVALALLASTLALAGVARWWFAWNERRAWRLGRFDDTTGY
jgi:ABC-2 type transport system permease protein